MKAPEHSAPLTPARIEHRRDLCAQPVTLNGKRAVIGGIRNRFATVAQLPDGERVEYAWETVERIVKDGGNFKS